MEVSGRKVEKGMEKLFCDPCNIDCLQKDALHYCITCNEFLCDNCNNNHRKSKASRGHKVLDENAMPSDKMASVRLKYCSKHKNEIINLFCTQHNELCCSVCVTLEHVHCKMQYMNDIAESEEYKDLLQTIKNLESQVTERTSMVKKTKFKVCELFDQLQASLHQYKKKINVKFETIERLIMCEAHQIQTDDTISLESTLTVLNTLENGLRDVSSNLERLETFQQNRQLFVSAKQAKTQVNGYANKLDGISLQNIGIREYTFKPTEEIMSFLSSSKLGSLEITTMKAGTIEKGKQINKEEIQNDGHTHEIINKSDKDVEVPANPDTTTEAEAETTKPQTKSKPHEQTRNTMSSKSVIWVRQINTKHETDGDIYQQQRNKDWITGIELIDIDTLALADHEYNSIKIVDLKSDTIMSCCKLNERPHDLTSFYQTRIVATCDSELVFLLFDSGKILIEKKLPVEPGCRGIANHRNKLFLTFVGQRPCVKVLDLDGNILRIFANDDTKPKALDDPQYIAVSTDGQMMFISDRSRHSVTIMDFNGNLKSSYKHKHLKYPTGLIQDENGDIIVAGMTSNSIHQISPQGLSSQILLGYIEWPNAMAYSGMSSRLYVTRCASDFISVYKVV